MSHSADIGSQMHRTSRSHSSSPELSSPPRSPDTPNETDVITVAHSRHVSHPQTTHLDASNRQNDGGEKSSSLNPARASAHAKTTPSATVGKKPRKNAKAKETAATDAKEPKQRKPRASSGATNPTKKKQKVEGPSESKTISTQVGHQPKITDLVGPSQPQPNFAVPATPASPQNRNNEAIPNNSLAYLGPGQTTQPRSAGQNYDPIRSTTMDPPLLSHNPFSAPQVSPTKSANRASASPSISSLIDPPNAPSFPSHQSSPPVPQAIANDSRPPFVVSPVSHHAPHLSPPAMIHVQQHHQSAPPPSSANPTPNTYSNTMDVDTDPVCTPSTKPATITTQKSTNTGTSTGPSSTAPSPKPPRQKEKESTAMVPPGNGLLSSALFGGPSDANNSEKSTAPTVILHVPLNGEINKYVNFARMAEERYGFGALHPRLAAQKKRLAEVAALGAALENSGKNGGSGVSGDEMSVDLSDMDGGEGGEGSNVEMGGMGNEKKDSEGPKPRKRRMKEDQYDKDDPFVDDAELAWEEQAAASKDGFFVYSGPLVPEGEKPTVERADGTVPKRGRGRGRGGSSRGGASGRGGAANANSSSNANTSGTGDGPTRTRGSGTTRKPRVTKAARALMEQEKADREKMAVLAAKPMGYPG